MSQPPKSLAESFAARFGALAAERSPLCVGIDPASETLAAWDLPDTAEGALEFGRRLVGTVGELVAVIKPQVAFFERFGPAGLLALSRITREATDAGALVLSDVKRLDIDSTLAAYAAAWLGPEAGFPSDAMTLGAYMGAAALRPAFDRAHETGSGVFVVVRSSNRDGADLQTARRHDDRTVADALADDMTAANIGYAGVGIGPVGAVIGATLDDAEEVLDRLKQSLILAPGIGAQGASIADLKLRFGATHAKRALPSVSRAIAGAGPLERPIREATRRLIEQAAELL
jgi:orotidine-5'-phosphate decarboxylase